jgi:hypothetical protein
MEFFGATTSSPNRSFLVIFQDVQIQLVADIKPVFTGGVLRVIRRLVPVIALMVEMAFFVQFAKPSASYWLFFPTTSADIIDGLLPERHGCQTGIASWYGGGGDGFSFKKTANGEIMDPDSWTCAHPTLPFGTIVKVVNLSNDRSTILRVNDRGPYIPGRVIDLSLCGAREIGLVGSGLAVVCVHVIDTIPSNHSANARVAGLKHEHTMEKITTIPQLGFTKIAVEALSNILRGLALNAGGSVQPNLAGQQDAVLWGLEEIYLLIKNRRQDPFMKPFFT